MPKKPKPKPRPCKCGCGLLFIPGRHTKYSPDCKTPIHQRYEVKQRKYRANGDYKKVKIKIEPKGKRKICSCGCGRPVGEGLRMLSDHCYKHSSDGSDQHKHHTRYPGMMDNRR